LSAQPFPLFPEASRLAAAAVGAKALKNRSEVPAVPDLVDSIIQQGLARRASDIHLESGENGLLVRFRVDGMLQDACEVPSEFRPAVIARIKIMSGMDITEHRLPQDGRIKIREKLRSVDIRISTLPSLYGEKVVMRLLDLDNTALPLSATGLAEDHLQELSRLIRRPQGVIFVTGPTGSGKTSTLYACLNDIVSETINIVTIEDPIEYEMQRATQIGVIEKIGLTFANCLRSVLRQDPDVILVGEVRDIETARIAMQASLTGHLVFATLHTNDAIGAITRLLDMEIPPYLIASSVNAILAQRLVRVLCPVCKRRVDPDDAVRAKLGLDEAVKFSRAPGCEFCQSAGIAGRTGIYELVVMTPTMRQLTTSRASEAELRETARAAGSRSLFQDGLRKVLNHTVAYEELLRVAEPDEGPAT
jgi:type II secretory ATPase GspE/PulE/Tfp pilus assembly ATPase PilB-like protein